MRTPRRFVLSPFASLLVFAFGAAPLGAIDLPYFENFDTAVPGPTRSPYNGVAGSGVNESTLEENPAGWVDGPPVSATSQASPWSILEEGPGQRVLRLEGPAKFDGNGLAYAGFSATNVPTGDGRGWEVSVEFRVAALGLNGNSSTLGIGVGAGARRLFISPSGGNFGRDEGYFFELYFESVKATDLASVPIKLRVLRSTGSLAEVTGVTVATGYLDMVSTYRLHLRGVGEGSALRLTATVENLTFPGSPVTLEYLDEAPLTIGAFGLRNRSAGFSSTVNHLLDLDVRFDNFAVEAIGMPDLTPREVWWQAHFGTMEPAGDAALDADPDGDGRANLIEYAMGTDPLQTDAVGPVMAGGLDTDRFAIEVRLRADAEDQIVALERAESPAGPWTEVTRTPVAERAAGEGYVTRRYEDAEPGETNGFYRLAFVVE